jgi:hypothetical protein
MQPGQRIGSLRALMEEVSRRSNPVADAGLAALARDVCCEHPLSLPELCVRCSLRLRAARDGSLATLAVLHEVGPGPHGGASPGCVGACSSAYSETPLHAAAAGGHAAAVAALLRCRGADANARDEEQQRRTPLMLAADAAANGAQTVRVPGATAVVRILLARAPMLLVDAVDEAGRTALSLAAAGGAATAVRLLLAAGAQPLVPERAPLRLPHAADGMADDDDDEDAVADAGAWVYTSLHRAASVCDASALCVRLLLSRVPPARLRALGDGRHSPLAAALAAGRWPACIALAYADAPRARLAACVRRSAAAPALRAFLAAPVPTWTPALHAHHPRAFRAAARTLLLCAHRSRAAPAAAAEPAAAADALLGAGLCALPEALLLRIVCSLAHEWTAAPPWPHELDAAAEAEAVLPLD